MSNQKETFSNDSTKKQLGFEYQKLIALEHCLNSKKGESVYIECFGDVLSNNTSLEVKHHEGAHNMTSNSIDAWKTIKNYVEEFDKVVANDKLILFTTSTIKSDSIFFNWNNLTANKKYTTLKDHIPSETCTPFKKEIFDTSKITKANLLKILTKFTIQSEQPDVQTKFEELKNHTYFNLIDNTLKGEAIALANGYIVQKAIENSNKWEINISDFIDDLKIPLSQLTKDYIPFPFNSLDKDDARLSNKDYVFVYKIKKVGLKEQEQQTAVSNYLRSERSYLELLSLNPSLITNLDRYDNNIEDDIKAEKSQISYSISSEDFKTNRDNEMSRQVYFRCLGKVHPNIVGVKDTEKYYRDGRIHNVTETTAFEWSFNEEEI